MTSVARLDKLHDLCAGGCRVVGWGNFKQMQNHLKFALMNDWLVSCFLNQPAKLLLLSCCPCEKSDLFPGNSQYKLNLAMQASHLS